MLLVLASTGAEGTAELRARQLRARLLDEGVFTVALALPLREAVEVVVDAESPPLEPIELVLPPLGSVEVELVDEQGAVWLAPEHVYGELSPHTLAELGDEKAERARTWQWRRTVDGRALFERVGLGLELRVSVEPDEHGEARVKVRGPEHPDERVQVRLAIGGRFPVVSGRVVDERGDPLGRVSMDITVRSGRGGRGGWARTDVDGRFRWAVELTNEWLGSVVGLDLTIRETKGMEHFAHMEGVRLSNGDTDLGDIVLARAPLVASGTVLDERGRPTRRAKVEFYVGATEGMRSSGTLLEVKYCDALGRFELRHELDEPLVGIGVDAEGCAYGGPWIVPVGSTGLQLAVERGGWVAGRVRNEGGVWPSLVLKREGEPVRSGTFSVDTPNAFRIGPVPSGTYSLAYGFYWMDELPTIDGLEVVAGEETRDPRLDPLDLSSLLPKLVLTVVDEEGTAVRELSVGAWRSSTGEYVECHPRGDGERWTIVAGTLPLRLRLAAPGFRALELNEVDSDRRIVMQHGIPVRIELTGALPELPSGWRLDGALRKRGASWSNRTAGFEWTPGAVELHVSEAGSYSLTFELGRTLPGGGEQHETSFWNEGGTTLDIVDGADAQVFRVEAPTPDVVREMSAYIEENE